MVGRAPADVAARGPVTGRTRGGAGLAMWPILSSVREAGSNAGEVSRMRIADRLAPIQLADPDGRMHRLGDFWSARTAVLVFVRHFG